eukprot:EG_transcript_7853
MAVHPINQTLINDGIRESLEFTTKDNHRTETRTNVLTYRDTHYVGYMQYTTTQRVPEVYSVEVYVDTTVTVKYIGPHPLGDREIIRKSVVGPNWDALYAAASQEVYPEVAGRLRRRPTIGEYLYAYVCILPEEDKSCRICRTALLCPILPIFMLPCIFCRAQRRADRDLNAEVQRQARALADSRRRAFWDNVRATNLEEAERLVRARILYLQKP